MTDTCIIYKASGATLDRTNFKTTRTIGTSRYTGPCRYWEAQAGNQVLLGDEEVTITQTFLSLPFNAPIPEHDDIVEITQSDDPTLVGTTVAVVGVAQGGGLRGSRVLSVQVVDLTR